MKKHTVLIAILTVTMVFAAASVAQETEPTVGMEDSSVTSLLSTPGPTFTVPTPALTKHWSIIAYGDTRPSSRSGQPEDPCLCSTRDRHS